VYEIRFYEDSRGCCPVDEFLDVNDVKVRAKFFKWLSKLKEMGPYFPRPYADVLRGKIRELRVIFGGNQYRFLYFFFGKKIIITHAFVKKTDRVPENEIERAEKMMIDFIHRHQRGDVEL